MKKNGVISGKRKGNTVTRLHINVQVTAQPLQRTEEKISRRNSNRSITFSMKEFQYALKTCAGSSPVPDDIHDEMIKQLSEKAKEIQQHIATRKIPGGMEEDIYNTHTKARERPRKPVAMDK
jgi:hypothetical protein